MAKSVSQLPGIISADLNFASGVMLLEYDPALDPRRTAMALVRKAGHTIEPLEAQREEGVAVFECAADDCSDCAAAVRETLEAVPGVASVFFEPGARRFRVGFDPKRLVDAELVDALREAGLPARLVARPPAETAERVHWWTENRTEIAVIVGGGLIAVAWLLGRISLPEWTTTLVYAAAILVSGTVTWRRAVVSVQARTIDMNVLMSVAVLGAVAIGEWSEAATVIWLFALGGLLESRSLARTRRSIRDLMDLTPATALVRRDDEVVEISPADVRVGEIVVVRPGERVPLDGTVSLGFSAVDESPITGESVPVDKQEGDPVYAGSLATTGLLEVIATTTSKDTTLARIVYLVEEAQASKAPSQRLVDRFTRWYTPAVVALSAAVALVPPIAARMLGTDFGSPAEWFYRGLVVLVISCPCALVISTPVAIVSAISRAARDGVLVKGGIFVELAGRVKAVAFDKTGTLTQGRPEVADVVALDGADSGQVMAIAGALEAYSTHPLATAVVRAAGDLSRGIHVRGFTDRPGFGVRGTIAGVEYELGGTRLLERLTDDAARGAHEVVAAQEAAGQTALVLVSDGQALAVIGLADQVRREARTAVAGLDGLGIEHVVMLTGDNERTAAAVGTAAGVREVRARLLPEDKTEAVGELRRRYGVVAMVGDGVNDAPSLAAADIGVAMGVAGSDTALETADVALMSDDLEALPRFFKLGQRTVRIILENVVFSIAIKAVTLVLAILGIATLWMAVFADMGVSLLVIANSMRLLRRAGREHSARNFA